MTIVLIFGVRTTQQTTLLVELPTNDPTASLEVKNATSSSHPDFHNNKASITLPVGDYIVTLNSALAPSPAAPIRATTDRDAIYMSVAASQSDPRPLVTGIANAVTVKDPKDPWPPSLGPGGTPAETGFLTASSILPGMAALLRANAGKGGDDAARSTRAEGERPRGTIAILEVRDGRVALGAGASGLIGIGTRLAVLPGELVPAFVDLRTMPQIEVTSVQATRAHARIVADPPPGAPAIAPGSQAVITTHAPALRRDVRWLTKAAPTAAELAAQAELEREIAADPTGAIGLATGDGADYQVAVEGGRFAVHDRQGQAVPNLRPEIAATGEGAARALKDRLVHLARFHAVQALTNRDPSSQLAGTLALSLHAAVEDPQQRAALPGLPTLPCDSEFYLRIGNRGGHALWLAIFDLAGDWSIEYVTQRSVEPGGFVDVRMTTALADGCDRARDALKVIATLEPVAPTWLALPPLDQIEAPAAAPSGPREPAPRPGATDEPSADWVCAQIELEIRR